MLSTSTTAAVTALLAATLTTPSALAAGLYDPALSWRTVTTTRFAVHYHEGARNLALRTARIAEDVLDDVGALFGFTPPGRIEIVLTDSSDDANGSAQVMPKNTLRLFLAAPTELTALSSYDDWLRILVIHELAHICDLDQAWGATRWLRLLFGKYVSMNAYTPQFLSEGVAVYAETLLSPTGRGRSSHVDMYLRMAALDDVFLDIDQAHVQLSEWPGPRGAYFYGGMFHLWLASRYGRDEVRRLHRLNAAMPVPYLYYPAAKSVFGKSLPALWREWHGEVLARARDLEAKVIAAGVTPSRRLTHNGSGITGARYSPDGRFILYSRSSPVDGATVRRIDRDGTDDRALVLETYSPTLSFGPGGERFYYSQSAVNERFNDYNDLYRYDIGAGRSTRLRDHARPRQSLRARDPDAAPDGKRIAFVQNALEQSWVSLGEIGGERGDELTVRVLVPPSGEVQHATPRFSPDGSVLALSSWFPGGLRDIVLVDAGTGALVRRVTHDRAQDGNPAWSPDGRFLLYESDADGISNLYAFEPATARYFRVTRVVGGAFQPDVAPDGRTLLFRNASGIGFDIHEMPFDPATWQAVAYDPARGYGDPASAAAPATLEWTTLPLPPALPRTSEPPLALAAKESEGPYSAWPTLLPFQDNWLLIPALFQLNGDPSLSLTTLGTDVLGRHTWVLAAGSGLTTRRLNWSAAYVNDVFSPTFVAAAGDRHATYGAGVADRRRTITAGMSLPVRQRHLLAATYAFEDRIGLTPETADELKLGRAAYAEAGYRYRLTRRFPYSVGDEHGGTLAAALRWYGRALGGDFDELLFTLDARAYFNNPLFDNHVLALRLAGAVAFGPDFEEKFFLGGAQGTSILSVQTDAVYPLRGFPLDADIYPGTTGLAAVYAEYRLPLLHVERGLWTLPVYVERLHGALFADAGAGFGDGSERSFAAFTAAARTGLERARLGAGGELRADVSLGWAYPLTLRLGVGFPVLVRGRRPVPGATPALYYFSFGTAL